jgi:glutaredoxin 3
VELYQAEWCEHSHRVRQRLTELGLDFFARQVPAEPAAREELREIVGDTEIPALVTDDGDAIVGEDGILEYLSRFE